MSCWNHVAEPLKGTGRRGYASVRPGLRRLFPLILPAIILAAGCIKQSGLSEFDKVHLDRAAKGRQGWVRRSFVPENQYGIKIKQETFRVGDPVRIIGVEYYLSESLVRLRPEDSSRELYLKLTGRTAFECERNLAQYLSFAPPGEDSEADSIFQATGHIHPKDHLQVLQPRTPLLAAADIEAPLKGVLAAGDRLGIMHKQEKGDVLWYEVEPLETGGMGWVSADWVSAPLFVYGPEDLDIYARVTDRERLPRYFRASLKAAGFDRPGSEPGRQTGWPVPLEEIIELKGLEPKMKADRVYRLLGPPDEVGVTVVYVGSVEAQQLDVWTYKARESRLEVRFRKDEVHNWRFVTGR